jgi:hypothetical protein
LTPQSRGPERALRLDQISDLRRVMRLHCSNSADERVGSADVVRLRGLGTATRLGERCYMKQRSEETWSANMLLGLALAPLVIALVLLVHWLLR